MRRFPTRTRRVRGGTDGIEDERYGGGRKIEISRAEDAPAAMKLLLDARSSGRSPNPIVYRDVSPT